MHEYLTSNYSSKVFAPKTSFLRGRNIGFCGELRPAKRQHSFLLKNPIPFRIAVMYIVFIALGDAKTN